VGRVVSAALRSDPVQVRLQVLLAALRPDCADPMVPPVATVPTCHVPAPRDPMASWGGTPPGMGRGGHQEAPQGALSAAGVLAEVDELPAPAGAVLRWLRAHARAAEGERGVAVSLALAFGAVDTSGNLGARREAAYIVGRALLWGAAGAWGR
jgi:hypothetical protein